MGGPYSLWQRVARSFCLWAQPHSFGATTVSKPRGEINDHTSGLFALTEASTLAHNFSTDRRECPIAWFSPEGARSFLNRDPSGTIFHVSLSAPGFCLRHPVGFRDDGHIHAALVPVVHGLLDLSAKRFMRPTRRHVGTQYEIVEF